MDETNETQKSTQSTKYQFNTEDLYYSEMNQSVQNQVN